MAFSTGTSSPSTGGPSLDQSSKSGIWDDLARDYDSERIHDTVYHTCTQEALHQIGMCSAQVIALDAGPLVKQLQACGALTPPGEVGVICAGSFYLAAFKVVRAGCSDRIAS
jgi:hypothetical protein